MSWLVPRERLTPAQDRAVEAGTERHRLVLGSPGSGKTVVLLHRARSLLSRHRLAASACRLLVYTNALKDYIRSGLQDLELPDDSVMTFDKWCMDYYRSHIRGPFPRQRDSKKLDWDGIRAAVRERAVASKSAEPLHEFVLVDEGQDLDCRDFETVAAVARHVTVFMDPKQKLYERDAHEQGVARALGLRRRNMSLLDAYRCSPYIVQCGAAFVSDARERRRFIEQNPPVQRGRRQVPLLYLADSPDQELKHLIEVVRTRAARGERVAILFPTVRNVFSYARSLKASGLEIEINQNRRDSEYESLDFGTSKPKLMAFPSSKGLTFDSVLMPRLNRKFLKYVDPSRLERWLFVGITRATRWIYVSSTDGESTVFLDRFRALEERRQFTIMRGAAPVASGPFRPPPVPRDKDESDLADLF